MNSDGRRKLCWECGGEVPVEVEQCPFCGATFEVKSEPFYSASSEEEVDSFSTSEPPSPLYQPIDSDAPLSEESEPSVKDQESRHQLICLCLLIPGFALLMFGIIMFFFSTEGYLTLKWDASWGMFIFALSALFIYFGARAYKKL